MPYADKEKNKACKKAYAEKHREEINAKISAKRKAREALWTPEQKSERKAQRAKAYRDNWTVRRRQLKRSQIKRRFGMSLEEYEAIRENQRLSGDLCGVCGLSLSTSEFSPDLDHDHDTGKTREFLHRQCNVAIGLLKDSSELCYKAAEYLEKYGK